MNLNLKTLLITLSIVACVLGLITFYVVFYGGGGTYVVSSDLGMTSHPVASTTNAFATSTPSSTIGTGAGGNTGGSSGSQVLTTQSGAAPITWREGNETMSITGASLSGGQLTLNVQIAMGTASECVPLNLRLVADENGDLSPPIANHFTFPDSGTCSGTGGETYSGQQVVFALSEPVAYPLILTTGGASNVLFEVDTTTAGGLVVKLPPNAG